MTQPAGKGGRRSASSFPPAKGGSRAVRHAVRALVQIGVILGAWLLVLAAEHLAVGIGYRALFAGSWEMGAARKFVSPIVLGALLPAAVLAYLFVELARNSVFERSARAAFALFGAAGAAAVGVGVSGGRHMTSLLVRLPFVAVLAVLGGVMAFVLAPRLAAWGSHRPRALAWAGALAAALFWCGDAFVLPRLYPAFHAGLFALTLGASALIAQPFFEPPRGSPSFRVHRALGGAMLALGAACLLFTPRAARRLSTVDNLRIVLLEHAPIMGRAVLVAATITPPPNALEGGEDPGGALGSPVVMAPATAPPGTAALDWKGRDIVLLSVDALRADHVGAYGYARPTTPNIDKLAAEGTLFESAYCPTPHTSYSITSMMTGKYMRPLLSLGLGEDSDTWAKLLRQYGHLTAAFYPPAVFFIDAARFTAFEKSGLDFEYRRVEFSTADERAEQVSRYLEKAPVASRALFLWVHLFEPHEPYVMHPEHPFGAADAPTDLDRYDSEIAAADAGIGKIVARVREKRPNAIILLTADHGEEFGEHGGRYHGTTVFEEQVHVPLVIAGAGGPRRVASVVQTIDLLPTVLSALGIPRPARVRGRDLGALIAGKPGAEKEPGLAFAETDGFTLLAKGPERVICARKAGACALYEPAGDPREEHDLGTEHPEIVKELRQRTAAIAREHGRLERGEAQGWPDALRRGSQGDVDAAEEVAALLDDVRVDVRRKAALVLFDLRAKDTIAALKRARDKDEDPEVQRACALALVRLGEPTSHPAEEALQKGDRDWKRRAALAFAEQGDSRGVGELTGWWSESTVQSGRDNVEVTLEFERGKEILAALAKLRATSAVGPLVHALGDVRLRPFIADALGAIGDDAAKAPLLSALARERYVPTRPHLARAALVLGAREELRPSLARFAGLPEPMLEAMSIAYEAKILDEAHGGWARTTPSHHLIASLTAPKGSGPRRLLVLLDAEKGASEKDEGVAGSVDGSPIPRPEGEGAVRVVELGPGTPGRGHVEVTLDSPDGIRGLWLLPHSEEIEPPAPEPWDGGTPTFGDGGPDER